MTGQDYIMALIMILIIIGLTFFNLSFTMKIVGVILLGFHIIFYQVVASYFFYGNK